MFFLPCEYLDGNVSIIPDWNIFSTPLVRGVMQIADAHLADEGFLVTLCLAEHLGKIVKNATRFSLQFYRSWTLMCSGGYLHPDTGEQVDVNTLFFLFSFLKILLIIYIVYML